jgi:hypothetical protein
MDSSVGSTVKVRLYSSKEVEAKITAITNQSAGRKISDCLRQYDGDGQS